MSIQTEVISGNADEFATHHNGRQNDMHMFASTIYSTECRAGDSGARIFANRLMPCPVCVGSPGAKPIGMADKETSRLDQRSQSSFVPPQLTVVEK